MDQCIDPIDPPPIFTPIDAPPAEADGICKGNPILPASAEKVQLETDWRGNGPQSLSFTRTYRSRWGGLIPASGLGANWSHEHAITLTVIPEANPTDAILQFGDGSLRRFNRANAAAAWIAKDTNDNLATIGSGFSYHRAADDASFQFDGAGQLTSQTQRNGWTTNYVYVSNRLTQISGPFGQTLGLGYNSAGQLTSVSRPDGQIVSYEYDSNQRLSTLHQADNTSKTYLYENLAYPEALTGILDENNVRYATWGYDVQGRANSSEHAGGTSHYQINYGGSEPLAPVTVTEPLGGSVSYNYTTQGGLITVTSSNAPSSTGAPDASARTQNSAGLVDNETDFKGAVTNYTWDTPRRLPLTITQAAGTADERVTTLQWHPTYRLPTLVTEPGRSTASSYDSLGNLLSRTITDTSVTPSTSRTWQWTYNPQGLVATATEPNGAVTSYTYNSAGNVIQATNALGQADTYTYDSAGRVLSHTAPTGLVSTYTWDVRGRLLSSSAGGLTTTLTYNAIGTLASLTQPSGPVTNYTYDAAHRLTGWSNNRGESGHYMLDGMGNRIDEYVQDSQSAIAWETSRSINSLNRLDTETLGADQPRSYGYDANGEPISSTNALSQSTQNTLDALRRVRTVTNSQYASATLDYTGDHLTDVTDFAGNATLYVRDTQGNPKREVSNDAGDSSATFDALGLPSQITNALGQATSISRDSLGRPTSIVRADGNGNNATTTLRYDLTGTTYNATGAPNASKGFLSEIQDPGTGTGTGITTRYQRDALGRITKKTQILAASTAPAPVAAANTRSISYSYVASGAGAGQLASITYPSGGVLGYSYDSSGRISALTWNGTPLVSNLSWTPLGQPSGWTWNMLSGTPTASRSYTTAGQLASASLGGSELASYQYDAAGRVSRLRQSTMVPTATGSTVASLAVDTTFSYDSMGRITLWTHTPVTTPSLPAGLALSAIIGPDITSYGYDANGNRQVTTYEQTNGNGSTQRRDFNYDLDPQSNRLLGHTQTDIVNGSYSGSPTSVAYQYNAAGQLTHTGATGLALAYDAAGRMGQLAPATTPAQTTTYQHNLLGQRVRKLDASKNTITLYGEAEQGMESMPLGLYNSQSATGATEVIYLPTASGPMPIATLVKGVKYAIHSDHLNTPRRLIQADGKVAWQWVTSAFGEVPPTTGKTRFVSPKVNPATTGTTTLTAFDLRYPGQVEDQESGLFYNHNRFYDPVTGRYLQADPIGLDGGWNGYLYSEANPLSLFDPDGLQVRQAPPSITYSGGIAAPRVQTLLSQIRQYNPSYSHQAIRPSTGPGSGYNNADVASLMGILRGYQNAQACTRDGVPIGRFVASQNGNVMLEPVGGSTVSYGRLGVDTHTLFPNGSNFQRLNPNGHPNNPTPHGHGHQMGAGPGRAGQGPSVDVNGNVVPANSGAAHWPLN